VGGFGTDGDSTAAGVTVSLNSLAAGTSASVNVWLTGFGTTEKITVTVTALYGSTIVDSTTSVGAVQSTRAVNGLATVSISPTALSVGLHGISAEGDGGSKASAALNIE
jgi:hypothetical protein